MALFGFCAIALGVVLTTKMPGELAVGICVGAYAAALGFGKRASP